MPGLVGVERSAEADDDAVCGERRCEEQACAEECLGGAGPAGKLAESNRDCQKEAADTADHTHGEAQGRDGDRDTAEHDLTARRRRQLASSRDSSVPFASEDARTWQTEKMSPTASRV